ncbi:hypothetical protein M514_10662 [Trichuris suis]|uniref:Uncharacterized protein n=1 Tax=Trichuris suis TaxID=68888 RepID=A0A085MY09_9BILA|nr:hypothetical protein M513_10662 [Trichuris suis]KFD62105.1 hypothetical protein M514_10662 [Trichuris suis]
MSLRWYFLNIRHEESAISFLHEKGVFHQERTCLSPVTIRWSSAMEAQTSAHSGGAGMTPATRGCAPSAPLRVDMEEAVETR